MDERVYIFDTTLRDGEQSPGVSLNVKEKLEIAQQLAKMKVDVIEAGFPVSSEGDFESVKLIAREVEGPIIAALARVGTPGDIEYAGEAVKYAKKPRIHVFIATSEIHMKYKLRKSRKEVIEAIKKGVAYAKQFSADIEFSPEDASRSELKFLCEAVATAIDAGATTINIPDTVGYATPPEMGKLISDIRRGVPNINKAVLSVHCHNDLGLAVANSLAAVENGVQQVEGAINGIGERAGNTALEEFIMALHTRKDFYKRETSINTCEIYRTSMLVSKLTGMPIQPNKAVVGRNAFAHEAGIHQDGVLKERTTYEIMNPAMIGLVQNNIVLGKHSGRHAFKKRLEELGFNLSEEELQKAFRRFKNLTDRKKEISDKDLEAIVEDEIRTIPEVFKLDYLQVSTGRRVSTATVGLYIGEILYEDVAMAKGPVDAVFKAIDKITGIKTDLRQFALNAITGGKDAMGEVTTKIEYQGKVYTGRGLSTDIIEASAKAYINSLNKLMYETGRGESVLSQNAAPSTEAEVGE